MNKKIMIIEDDPETQFLFSTLLESEGYTVVCAVDGNVALERLKENEIPDLIFMDLSFPGGTPEEFREEQLKIDAAKDIPVILISGKEDIADYAIKLNAKGYIKKPFEIDPLVELIAGLL